MKEGNNFAFIDNQNLYQGVKELGWRLDWKKFRRYLLEKYQVSRVYLFLGYVKENKKMYEYLERAGFILRFRKISKGNDKDIKGNVDVLLTLQTILEINDCNQVVLITSDGDFYPLVDYLIEKDKFLTILSPHSNKCSHLLKESAHPRIGYLNNLRNKIEDIKK